MTPVHVTWCHMSQSNGPQGLGLWLMLHPHFIQLGVLLTICNSFPSLILLDFLTCDN